MSHSKLYSKVYGTLAGGAIGDATGGVTEMMHYETIAKTFGEIDGPRDYGKSTETARFDPDEAAGRYTDDTRLKHLLVDLIAEKSGRVTSDDFGHHLQKHLSGWYYTPVINAYHKMVTQNVRPRDAGRGNMGSNSTAMAIAPIGVINAGNPKRAAANAYDVASVIHEGYSLDSAALMAAMVAAAFAEKADVDSVIAAALASVDAGSPIPELVMQAVDLAKATGNYVDFRREFYEKLALPWPQEPFDGQGLPPAGFYDTAEPREAVPATIGLLVLSEGNPKIAINFAANFGRDSDTIGSMIGGVAGALSGIEEIPQAWIDVLDTENDESLSSFTDKLYGALVKSVEEDAALARQIQELNVGGNTEAELS